MMALSMLKLLAKFKVSSLSRNNKGNPQMYMPYVFECDYSVCVVRRNVFDRSYNQWRGQGEFGRAKPPDVEN